MDPSQRLMMLKALLAKKPTNALHREQPGGLLNALNKPLPMEGRFGLLPIKEQVPGMGPSLFNKRELALPGLLAGAVNAFTAPGRAASGQQGFKPEEEAANFAGNFMGGGLLGSRMAPAPRGSIGMNAYHGSPHKFDKFDMGKIGTGEGNQTFGHGLYFAENPKVAGQYRDMIKPSWDVAEDPYNTGKFVGMVLDQNTKPYKRQEFATRGEAEKWAKETAQQITSEGHVYHVDIPDEAVGKMLDWDKPLNQQPANVRTALGKLAAGDDPILAELFAEGAPAEALGVFSSSKGGQIYNTLAAQHGGPAALSKKLRELGITGVRYLDGDSRSAGRGTRNIVVFDDKLARITKRE